MKRSSSDMSNMQYGTQPEERPVQKIKTKINASKSYGQLPIKNFTQKRNPPSKANKASKRLKQLYNRNRLKTRKKRQLKLKLQLQRQIQRYNALNPKKVIIFLE